MEIAFVGDFGQTAWPAVDPAFDGGKVRSLFDFLAHVQVKGKKFEN